MELPFAFEFVFEDADLQIQISVVLIDHLNFASSHFKLGCQIPDLTVCFHKIVLQFIDPELLLLDGRNTQNGRHLLQGYTLFVFGLSQQLIFSFECEVFPLVLVTDSRNLVHLPNELLVFPICHCYLLSAQMHEFVYGLFSFCQFLKFQLCKFGKLYADIVVLCLITVIKELHRVVIQQSLSIMKHATVFKSIHLRIVALILLFTNTIFD